MRRHHSPMLPFLARSRAYPATATGAHAQGALTVGSIALGALAAGALAVGALAIGRLFVGRARIKRLEIDELVVRRLRIIDGMTQPARSERTETGDGQPPGAKGDTESPRS